jgi:beta-phosphoglucomutase-like phosphatase (HAD superfamily)
MKVSREGGDALPTLPTRIRALVYDFDDTIVATGRVTDALLIGFLRERHGIGLGPRELEALNGLSWSGTYAWLAENRGLRVPKDEVWSRFLAVKGDYLRRRRLRVASGLQRMLALPVPQAIVSGSTRAELAMVMENIGMRPEEVRLVLCDEDCGPGKPDPTGFLRALGRLGVPAGETLVFEDSPPGIEAAHRAGMPVAFMAELAARDCAGLADMRFGTFDDAVEWVRGRIRVE